MFRLHLGSLKGKTVGHPNPHVKAGVDPVLPDILKVHGPIVITINIMFVNITTFILGLLKHFQTDRYQPSLKNSRQ